MRFAISIPQFYADGEFDPVAFRNFFAAAEQLAYDSAWAHESVLSGTPQLSPIEAMTYAAACTQRLRLGCAVFVSTLHGPVHLAGSLATLDQLSGGRVDVGIGTGGGQRPFAAFGISADRYVARFTEGLAVMKALWTQQRVSFDGEFWQLTNAAMEPKPVQKPYPPVWIGASAPSAALTEAGRDPGGFPIAKRLYIGVDDNSARARERMRAAIAGMYGRPVPEIEAAAVAGTPAECADAVARTAAAGAELILFTTLFDEGTQAARLADEIIPQLN
jgi:alkanesulfonate monooxygenase SsuD/methylene tetrahydromethanopterin reductase-like flavin-dependent oxidoreductase (luciferase family)